MDEYISKTKFEELMRKKARSNFDLYYVDKSKHYHEKAIGYNTAADEAHDFPAADVQPVKSGRWEYSEKEYGECAWYFCSFCDEPAEQLYNDEPLLSEFCPHCGARMGGDEE